MKKDNNEVNSEGQQTFAIEESALHEATWLIWPNKFHFEEKKGEGKIILDGLEWIWVKIVKALSEGENVNIIVSPYYKKYEDAIARIEEMLIAEGVDRSKFSFFNIKTDTIWVRDTGPIFAKDISGKAVILDFKFDSWGGKRGPDGKGFSYDYDNKIPIEVHKKIEEKGIQIVRDIDFILEGGAFDYDGNGKIMACESSVVSKNRNPEKNKGDAAAIFNQFFGVDPENIIWLKGKVTEKLWDKNGEQVKDADITDCHIDGLARFYGKNTIIVLPKKYFPKGDFETLCDAKNADGNKYRIIELPASTENMDEWAYINYYIGNEVILLPVPTVYLNLDVVNIISELYPDKKIVPIDVRNLVKHGGAIHCITQQQPEYPIR